MEKIGEISLCGIGPGGEGGITADAALAIEDAEVVVGYGTYLGFIKNLITDQKIIGTGMKQEIERCRLALDEACAGKKVAVVSGGDSGIYGMAGLVLELMLKREGPHPKVQVVAGVSAAQAAAAVLGAPLMHDFAVISLSDLMTPWSVIERRIKAAAEADFVIAVYNPKSRTRTEGLLKLRQILLDYRGESTPVGIVTNAKRDDEVKVISNLRDFAEEEINMRSILIIGSSKTYVKDGFMITPRGYEEKYGGDMP